MTEDETAFREVDTALAEDKRAAAIRKNLPALIGGAVLIVVSVGGWQLWERQKTAISTENALEFRTATEALTAGDDSAAAAFEKIADGASGYAMLAKLRLAAIRAGEGDNDKALSLLRDVYSSSAAPKRLKDLARIRAAYISIAKDRAEVIKDAGPLETDETSMGYYGREILALAAFKDGDYQAAEDMFRRAASSVGAPESVRQRAEEFAALSSAGKAGVEFGEIEESDKSQVDRFIESLQKAGGDLGSVLETAGGEGAEDHDHVESMIEDETATDVRLEEIPSADQAPTEQGNE